MTGPTGPTGPHWLLRHPDEPGKACVISDEDFVELWHPNFATGTTAERVTLVSLEEFLSTARKDK